MSAPQLETENCVAHNGSIIPVPGRDIFVQAWYQGGISVIDFTDSSKPFEIAYFDRGPIMEEELITGGYWSVYYYEGFIYGTEITRGLDTLKLLPSDYISENEIAAAALAYPAIGPRRLFNPQQQVSMAWPARPEVARAYIDQLSREGILDRTSAEVIFEKLDRVESAKKNGSSGRLSQEISGVILPTLDESENTITKYRLDKLDETLKSIADSLTN